jgi:hypothetical protein
MTAVKEGIEMPWIKTKWTPEQADKWTKEDYITFFISPVVYVLLALGVAFSLLLLWYGWVMLAASIILLVVMIKIIDPKLKAISEDYETKQKKYLEDLEKIARWEE